MTAGRWAERDRVSVAAAEKVRFFSRSVVHGRGSTLTTDDGQQLIDLSATWTAAGLGYGDRRVRAAVDAVLADSPGFGLGSLITPQSVLLAERLLSCTPIQSAAGRVYFGHSGSDANDVAVRLCRRNCPPQRQRVLAFEHSYHGGLGESLGFSGVQVEGGASADPCVTFLPYPDPEHPHLPGAAAGDELGYSLDRTRAALAAGDVACLIVEPILSDGGMIVPPDGFLAGLRQLCDETGTLMICDEVKVGLGRPGTLHAYQHDQIRPDLVTLGKALGGGIPISAVVGDAGVLDSPAGAALLTMGGNPVSAAAALAVLDALAEDDLPARAAKLGHIALRLLHQLTSELSPAARSRIASIRGRGLAIGVELDDGSEDVSSIFAEKVAYRASELGVIVYYVGGHVLEITPALTIPEAQLTEGLRLIFAAVEDVVAGLVSDAQIAGYGGW